MTWGLVLGLAVASYAFKAIGLVVIGARRIPPMIDRCLALIPAALVSALIVGNTVASGQQLVLDGRAAGVAAAAVAAWRRAPMVVVIVVGMVVTAIVRAG